MENKDLKKMNRTDLLKILVQQNHEIERLEQEVKDAKKQLADRELAISEFGSIAEAAVGLNGVFTAAQAACQQYIENIKLRSDKQEQICAEMERATKEKCERMILDAQKQASAHWEQTNRKIQQVLQETEGLKKLLSL